MVLYKIYNVFWGDGVPSICVVARACICTTGVCVVVVCVLLVMLILVIAINFENFQTLANFFLEYDGRLHVGHVPICRRCRYADARRALKM